MKYISVVIVFSGIIKLIILIREKCVLTFKKCTNFWQEVECDILFLISFFENNREIIQNVQMIILKRLYFGSSVALESLII